MVEMGSANGDGVKPVSGDESSRILLKIPLTVQLSKQVLKGQGEAGQHVSTVQRLFLHQ